MIFPLKVYAFSSSFYSILCLDISQVKETEMKESNNRILSVLKKKGRKRIAEMKLWNFQLMLLDVYLSVPLSFFLSLSVTIAVWYRYRYWINRSNYGWACISYDKWYLIRRYTYTDRSHYSPCSRDTFTIVFFIFFSIFN